ncbi:hypothetical protein D9615_007029 [Tricholomella constricta]|uniref:YMC020W-like alpha/beta hydrolase domain-containing protein n=1 Tax=Tricholomella constricta TaxID=117010 RepID=A0A8H5H831_9AGAR|nr:hypothetical protein D9615_007029 [Tricholomella constricta]
MHRQRWPSPRTTHQHPEHRTRTLRFEVPRATVITIITSARWQDCWSSSSTAPGRDYSPLSMPSSRHSSRSTRSPKPPTWRTVTISKNSAASTSLSYVFAEPEQGSPLAPATSKLPSSRSLNNIETEDRLPRRLVSMSSVQRDMNATAPEERTEQNTLGVSQGESSTSAQGSSSRPNVPPADAPRAPDAQLSLPPIIDITDSETPTNTTNASALSSSPVKPSSWFGSLTRAKGKAKAAQMNARAASSPAPSPAADAQPNGLPTALSVPSNISQAAVEPLPSVVATESMSNTAPPEPATAPVTPAPTPTPPTLPKDIPPPPQVKRSWFSSAAATPSAPLPEPQPAASNSNSIPSSIDNEVPGLPTITTSPSPPPPQQQAAPTALPSPGVVTSPSSGGGDGPRLSSLNPSTGRFTLSIPLLGRPKIPLDRVVSAAVHSKEEREGSKTKPQNTPVEHTATTLTAPLAPAESKSTEPEETTHSIRITNTTDSAPAHRPETSPEDANTVTTLDPSSSASSAQTPLSSSAQPPSSATPYSWWVYVGWGSSTDTSSSPAPSDSASASASAAPLSAGPESRQDKHVNSAQVAGCESDAAWSATTTTMDESGGSQSQPHVREHAHAHGHLRMAHAHGHIHPHAHAHAHAPASSASMSTVRQSAGSKPAPPRPLDTSLSTSSTNTNTNTTSTTSTSTNTAVSTPTLKPKSKEKAGPDPDSQLNGTRAQVEEQREGSGSQQDASAGAGAAEQSKNEEQSGGSMSAAVGAWYSPWAWYGAAAPAPAVASAVDAAGGSGEGEERDGKGKGEGEGDAQLTQAEMVKEAALAQAREACETQAKSSSEEEAPGREPDLNPVGATIATNRSGWASFFSSRSLIMKTITAGPAVDENGMEVMDIDEDEGEGQAGDDAPPAIGTGEEEEVMRGRARNGEKDKGGRGGANVKSGPMKLAGQKQVVALAGPSTSKKDNKSAASSRSSSIKPDVPPAVAPITKGSKPSAPPPLTISDSVKRDTLKPSPTTKKNKDAPPPVVPPLSKKKKSASASPAPSTKSGTSTPGGPRTPTPNLILPTWADTFHTSPRSVVPPPPASTFSRTMKFVSGVLFAADKPEAGEEKGRDGGVGAGNWKGKGKGKAWDREREREFMHFGKELPRAWDVVMQGKLDPDVLRGCRRVVVIGIHGWFPGAVMRSVLGEPTGTSGKFVNMMVQALEEFQEQHGVKLEKITRVPLEGEGTIDGRVAKLYANLQANQEWMDDLHAADAILVATHSQGSIVSTHLLDRLIQNHHIRTSRNTVVAGAAAAESFPAAGLSNAPVPKPQRVCCLALCGIHLGPLRYLSSSSLLQPYFQYFESAAARELFEFQVTTPISVYLSSVTRPHALLSHLQNTESEVSKNYVTALRSVVDHGTKMVYVASLNDQVVPIYSGLFTAASHPLILRALYIDGDAYHSSDFLSNLLVLLLRILNSGISDSGLTVHLSEATAGSLSGVGHSTAYEEVSTYSLAVKYLFLTNDGLEDQHTDLVLEPFNATMEQNDYEIPWSLRDVIADERVSYFFSREIAELRDAFRDWHPKTTILRDLKRKLQPIQRLPSSFPSPSSSKL